jgi:hypothetical protein
VVICDVLEERAPDAVEGLVVGQTVRRLGDSDFGRPVDNALDRLLSHRSERE